jgi:hypothetical protein
MKKLMVTALCIGAGCGATGAQALSRIPFGELDVNRDDALTMTEAGLLPDIISLWGALDRDGDGRLNRGEYAAYQLPDPAAGERD